MKAGRRGGSFGLDGGARYNHGMEETEGAAGLDAVDDAVDEVIEPELPDFDEEPADSRDLETAAERHRRRSRRDIPEEGALDAELGVEAFLRALERSEPWYPALLAVIARWTAPSEQVEDVTFHYLIEGEAFDWLRLAQRLIEAAEHWLPGSIPDDERVALLFFGMAPDGSDEESFGREIGPQKHRAHLNFQYGVVVEEVLLLSAEQELLKAGTSTSAGRAADVLAYDRVYGKPFDELVVLYRAETGEDLAEHSSLTEFQRFTYWCSKYRFRMAEPARVASDTRKALALLSQLDASRRRLARALAADEHYIDIEGPTPVRLRQPPKPRARMMRR